MSGGQFQRLLVAFALVGNPNVLLLDEPTARVDEPGHLDLGKEAIKIIKVRDVALHAVTFLPISFTAVPSSDSWRPVINTFAPSSTNRFAVAKPIPLVPSG
jgi:ABC-type taurine transport system ATPase subunit